MTDAHAALMSQGVAHLEGGLVFRQRRGVGLWGIIPPPGFFSLCGSVRHWGR